MRARRALDNAPGRRAPGGRLRGAVGIALVLLGLGALVATSACSEQRHYKLLSFFFDGVPDPNAPPTDAPVYGPRQRTGPLSLEERKAIQDRRTPVSTHSFHPPYRDKQCSSCHGVQRQGDWLQGIPELRAPVEQLCGRCHQRPQQEFVHGPVATLSCYLCHEHHSSPNPHLLKAADPSTLCARCHTGPTFTTREQHQSYGDRSCVECHDPHASARRFLLRPEPTAAPATPADGERKER